MPAKTTRLTLYGHELCEYCRQVERVLDELGVEYEKRNPLESADAMQELLDATDAETVPVMRIETQTEGASETRWLPESGEIIRFLEERYGDPESAPTAGRGSNARRLL
ncbi:MAG: glutathione S-transferase N-terminal domain-containing protein, partial [Myxococcales bacterium]|nr:glutathione S-transferase N-terminal domain-containing protein [Myxococcales bacterium]